MSLEVLIYTALAPLVSNRVYRDVAKKTETAPVLPYITFQQVGGTSVNFLDSTTIPSKKNARVQVNVWHNRRDEAMALARDVEDALRVVTLLHTNVLGAPIAVFEEKSGPATIDLYGSVQDFSFWYDD